MTVQEQLRKASQFGGTPTMAKALEALADYIDQNDKAHTLTHKVLEKHDSRLDKQLEALGLLDQINGELLKKLEQLEGK